MTHRDVVRILREHGWILKDQRGSHEQYIHPDKKVRVTVPNHAGKDLKPGTLANIWRQAGIDSRETK